MGRHREKDIPRNWRLDTSLGTLPLCFANFPSRKEVGGQVQHRHQEAAQALYKTSFFFPLISTLGLGWVWLSHSTCRQKAQVKVGFLWVRTVLVDIISSPPQLMEPPVMSLLWSPQQFIGNGSSVATAGDAFVLHRFSSRCSQ